MKQILVFVIAFSILISPMFASGQNEKPNSTLYSEFKYYDDAFGYLSDQVSYMNDEFVYASESLEPYSNLFVYYEDEMLYLEDELLYEYADDVAGFKVLLLDTQEYLSSEIFPSDLFLMNPATADILKGSIVLVGIIIAHSVFPGVGWAIPFISSFQQGTSTAIFATKVISATVASGVASGIVETTVDWAQDGILEDETFYEGFAEGFKWAAYTYAFEMGVQGAKYQFGHSNPTKGLLSADDYSKIKGREIINKDFDNIKPPKPQSGAKVSSEYLRAVDEGVPLINGQRDFSKFSKRNFEFRPGELTGNVTKDKKILQDLYGITMDDFPGCTLHHAPDGRTLMMIPTDLHNAVRHTGGNALIQAFTQAISSEMKQKQVRDFSVAISGGVIVGQLEDNYE